MLAAGGSELAEKLIDIYFAVFSMLMANPGASQEAHDGKEQPSHKQHAVGGKKQKHKKEEKRSKATDSKQPPQHVRAVQVRPSVLGVGG